MITVQTSPQRSSSRSSDPYDLRGNPNSQNPRVLLNLAINFHGMIVSGIVHKLWANCRSKVYVSSLSVIGGWRPRLASVSSTQGWGFSTSRDSSPLTPTNAPKEMKRWTPDDDSMLRKAVEAHGKNWNEVVKLLPHKTVIQCRARWVSSLDPDIKLGSWSHTVSPLFVDTAVG